MSDGIVFLTRISDAKCDPSLARRSRPIPCSPTTLRAQKKETRVRGNIYRAQGAERVHNGLLLPARYERLAYAFQAPHDQLAAPVLASEIETAAMLATVYQRLDRSNKTLGIVATQSLCRS